MAKVKMMRLVPDSNDGPGVPTEMVLLPKTFWEKLLEFAKEAAAVLIIFGGGFWLGQIMEKCQ